MAFQSGYEWEYEKGCHNGNAFGYVYTMYDYGCSVTYCECRCQGHYSWEDGNWTVWQWVTISDAVSCGADSTCQSPCTNYCDCKFNKGGSWSLDDYVCTYTEPEPGCNCDDAINQEDSYSNDVSRCVAKQYGCMTESKCNYSPPCSDAPFVPFTLDEIENGSERCANVTASSTQPYDYYGQTWFEGMPSGGAIAYPCAPNLLTQCLWDGVTCGTVDGYDECGVCNGSGVTEACLTSAQPMPYDADSTETGFCCNCDGDRWDCNGDCGGTAYIDDCGACVMGATGLSDNYLKDGCGDCGTCPTDGVWGNNGHTCDGDADGYVGSCADGSCENMDCGGQCLVYCYPGAQYTGSDKCIDDAGVILKTLDDCGDCDGGNARKDCAGNCTCTDVWNTSTEHNALCAGAKIDSCGDCYCDGTTAAEGWSYYGADSCWDTEDIHKSPCGLCHLLANPNGDGYGCTAAMVAADPTIMDIGSDHPCEGWEDCCGCEDTLAINSNVDGISYDCNCDAFETYASGWDHCCKYRGCPHQWADNFGTYSKIDALGVPVPNSNANENDKCAFVSVDTSQDYQPFQKTYGHPTSTDLYDTECAGGTYCCIEGYSEATGQCQYHGCNSSQANNHIVSLTADDAWNVIAPNQRGCYQAKLDGRVEQCVDDNSCNFGCGPGVAATFLAQSYAWYDDSNWTYENPWGYIVRCCNGYSYNLNYCVDDNEDTFQKICNLVINSEDEYDDDAAGHWFRIVEGSGDYGPMEGTHSGLYNDGFFCSDSEYDDEITCRNTGHVWYRPGYCADPNLNDWCIGIEIGAVACGACGGTWMSNGTETDPDVNWGAWSRRTNEIDFTFFQSFTNINIPSDLDEIDGSARPEGAVTACDRYNANWPAYSSPDPIEWLNADASSMCYGPFTACRDIKACNYNPQSPFDCGGSIPGGSSAGDITCCNYPNLVAAAQGCNGCIDGNGSWYDAIPDIPPQLNCNYFSETSDGSISYLTGGASCKCIFPNHCSDEHSGACDTNPNEKLICCRDQAGTGKCDSSCDPNRNFYAVEVCGWNSCEEYGQEIGYVMIDRYEINPNATEISEENTANSDKCGCQLCGDGTLYGISGIPDGSGPGYYIYTDSDPIWEDCDPCCANETCQAEYDIHNPNDCIVPGRGQFATVYPCTCSKSDNPQHYWNDEDCDGVGTYLIFDNDGDGFNSAGQWLCENGRYINTYHPDYAANGQNTFIDASLSASIVCPKFVLAPRCAEGNCEISGETCNNNNTNGDGTNTEDPSTGGCPDQNAPCLRCLDAQATCPNLCDSNHVYQSDEAGQPLTECCDCNCYSEEQCDELRTIMVADGWDPEQIVLCDSGEMIPCFDISYFVGMNVQDLVTAGINIDNIDQFVNKVGQGCTFSCMDRCQDCFGGNEGEDACGRCPAEYDAFPTSCGGFQDQTFMTGVPIGFGEDGISHPGGKGGCCRPPNWNTEPIYFGGEVVGWEPWSRGYDLFAADGGFDCHGVCGGSARWDSCENCTGGQATDCIFGNDNAPPNTGNTTGETVLPIISINSIYLPEDITRGCHHYDTENISETCVENWAIDACGFCFGGGEVVVSCCSDGNALTAEVDVIEVDHINIRPNEQQTIGSVQFSTFPETKFRFTEFESNDAQLIHHWKLDENTGPAGTTVYDTFGTHGTIVGPPIWKNEAPFGFIFTGDTGSTHIELGNSLSSGLAGKDFTISFWMLTTEVAGHKMIVGFYTAAGGNIFMIVTEDGRIKIWRGGHQQFGPFIADGQYHHISVTYTISHAHVFVDGKKEGEWDWGGAYFTISPSNVFVIGADMDSGPSYNQYFEGQINNLKIYEGIKIPAKLHLLTPEGGLDDLGYTGDFDGDTDGTSPTAGDDGAYDFDGSDYILLSSEALIPTADLSFTIMAWIKTDTTTDYKCIVAKRDSASDALGFQFDIRSCDAGICELGFAIDDGPAGHNENWNGSTQINTGNWEHVAVTIDRETHLGRLYVNGVFDNNSDVPHTVAAVTSAESDALLAIGSKVSPAGDGTHHWDGLIKDVRIYESALTESEIINIIGNDINVVMNTDNFGGITPQNFRLVEEGTGKSYINNAGIWTEEA